MQPRRLHAHAHTRMRVVGDAHNVIIQNMTIGLLQGGEDADSISLEGNSSGEPSKIWVDHNTISASLTKCSGAGDASFDGGIDMKKRACTTSPSPITTSITIKKSRSTAIATATPRTWLQAPPIITIASRMWNRASHRSVAA
ncbi:hypothetical protein C9397_05040 [Xanthomonas vasicola pv. vasculorum]|uniref:Pectate lyase domain-containing protein n=1 Tax=Xanthomonas vasicola pv. vasculorum TaxID=325776 RepID=A0AAE8F879_XANVA|nr:hypothetical protein C7V42_15265 [Xanthomonas vasicola pv. vasculorum]AZR30328.1 hypothetical protein KWO_007060 [Xanthomonas vasicola pv. musacearum NCPPB 4379]RJL82700.1 hypothetical protein DEG03_012940 [Xanthomonas vasicola]RRJ39206.1 hypothetical protein EIM46_13130 [Xanthomonas vasicola pv. musacearum]AZM71963.1 hypothetical protein CXP37_15280 [Xanthomonas vasicola pv. vasculorum]